MKRTSRSTSRKPVLSLIAFAIAQCSPMAAIGIAPGMAMAATRPAIEFQQAALPLPEALLAIARKAMVTVSFDPALVDGLTAAPVRGTLTVEQALAAALQGTDLESLPTERGAFAIARKLRGSAPIAAAAGAGGKPMASVVVSGERLRDTYVATHSSGATRSSAALMEVSQSVSSVSKELLNDQQVTNMLEALRNVSGVSQSAVPNGPEPSIQIRGFLVDNVASDGMLSTGAASLYMPTIGIEKLEVIKGPESIIGGTGAAFGGVVNMVTKTPQATTAREIQYGMDSQGRRQIGADLNGAFNEGKELRGRVVMSAEKGGDTDLGWKGGNNFYVAPSLAWKDSKNYLSLAVEAQNFYRPLGNFVYSTSDYLAPDAPTVSHAEDDHFQYRFRKYSMEYLRNLDSGWTVRARARHETSESAGQYWGQNPTAAPAAVGTPLLLLAYAQKNIFTTNTVQTEVGNRFDRGGTEHRVLAGIDFRRTASKGDLGFRYDAELVTMVPSGGTQSLPSVVTLPNYFPVLADASAEAREGGIFLQDQIAIGEKWHAMLAGRYMMYRPAVPDDLPNLSKFLPSLGVYQPVPGVSLYGSFSKGITTTFQYRTRAGAGLPPPRPRSSSSASNNLTWATA